MQTSYGHHDHRERHRYRSRLCARQHGRDHRVPVGRVRDRMVHRSAASTAVDGAEKSELPGQTGIVFGRYTSGCMTIAGLRTCERTTAWLGM
jgi:hypothetical protein